ncbi:hypothetical protein OQX61_21945 [Pedobacter sp. PLR]|uniref:hypothetical protein n=1 Tax=Pedobacter sp. PLR TaxID=2994465 RepID=UPI0022478973|nr:hypothetical protein [Pedobacter sp. PLR]MCX2453946.1 hypothetical protein [Pedobacter sp. PLR]
MKLTLKISATIVLLLLISVYGYLYFRESRSYDQQVAKDASVVYKLNVDGLLKTMAVDFIGNPGYYLKTKEKGGQKPDFSLPANVFVYSLKTKAPGTFFTELALSDTTGLNAWLKRVLKITDFAVQGAGNRVGTSSDRKITVLNAGKTFAIAYSFKREAVLEELNDILGKKNRMEGGTPLMIALKKAKGHLSWTAAAGGGQLNFKDGLAEIEGSFPTEGLDIPDQPRSMVEFADHALIKIRVNAGFKTSGMPKDLSLKGISVQTDTLLKSYLGFAALEMGPAITQMDSLIAYEYNDDFEKVATVQLKKVRVPKLKLSIGARTAGLLAYLKENQVISTEDRLNKELFPLYQVFSRTKNNIWQLSTLENDPVNETEAIRNTSKTNPDFFALTADLRGIKAQQVFPLLNKWLKPFSHLKITAAKIDNGTARLNGTLEFEDKNINAFIQMIQ